VVGFASRLCALILFFFFVLLAPARDGEEAGAVVGWGGKVPYADGVARCACLRGLWV
jgi:hypothetical protein